MAVVTGIHDALYILPALLYKLCQLYSLHGQNKDALAKTKVGAWEYDIIGPWYKCNMTDIMAAIGLRQLDRYPGLLERRKQIIEKYIEMNVAHPFREGNGRSTRIWLDAILKNELGQVIDWSKIDKEDYLFAMERSPVRNKEIMMLLKEALTNHVDDRQVYMKGIDASYKYEGYSTYKIEEL